MAFQFQCPDGHLLEAEDADAGKTCQCPYCGVTIEIPHPGHAGPGPSVPPVVAPAQRQTHSQLPPVVRQRKKPAAPVDDVPDFFAATDKEVDSSGLDVTRPADLFHIDCPNGHELEVEREMLEQSALCPYCNVKFKLREKESTEWKRKQQIREELHERKVSNRWLNWAVAISVLTLLFLLGLALLWNK